MRHLILFVIATMLFAACTGQETTTTTDTSTDTNDTTVVDNSADSTTDESNTTDNTSDNSDATDSTTDENTTAENTDTTAETTDTAQPVAYDAPDWTTLPLTNARTGESFTLADLAGKTVMVEPMATWCSNCRQQQTHVVAAMGQLNPEDFVFISVSVESITDNTLAEYADGYGYEQVFVVGSPEFIRALIDQFGRAISSPPSTPHFTISPTGALSDLVTGIHNSAEIIEFVQAAAGA